MPKLSALRNARDVRAEDLRDPAVATEYDRTELAHAVAMQVLSYRTEHGLSQSALGRALGMAQPAIARLEASDHEPSLATLARLARTLGIEFHIDITADTFGLRTTA